MALTRISAPKPKLDYVQKIITKLEVAYGKTLEQFEKMLQPDGSYGANATDIACYFKSPMMFIAADKPEQARKVMQFIKTRFMAADGDFKSTPDEKSKKPEYIEYYTYTNGWIVRAAHELNDAMYNTTYTFLEKFYGNNELFLTNHKNLTTDVLTIAHQGLINLESNNFARAEAAGDQLINVFNKQKDKKNGFYLRLYDEGTPILHCEKTSSLFYYVSAKEPNQLYFMIGYPCAFLAILYKKTRKHKFLNAAKDYFDFALACNPSIFTSHFSHKIAWAASLLFEITGQDKYLAALNKITQHFLSTQSPNGLWLVEEGENTFLDQSAEIACWLIEIKKQLNEYIKKNKPENANAEMTSSMRPGYGNKH